MKEIIDNWQNIKRLAMLNPELKGLEYDRGLQDELGKILGVLKEVADLPDLEAVEPMGNPIEFWRDNLPGMHLVGTIGANMTGRTTEAPQQIGAEQAGLPGSGSVSGSKGPAADHDMQLAQEELRILANNNVRKDLVNDGNLQGKGLFDNTRNSQFGYFIVPKVLPSE